MKIKRQISTVFHLVDEANWQSIKQYGLKTAAQLLIEDNKAHLIDQHRAENVILDNGLLIRDQKPIPPQALSRCLATELSPNDWYTLLNQRIFFWLDKERLNRQLKACNSPQYVITIDANNLLLKYGAYADVTPFNVGNARRAAAFRGRATFVPYQRWVNSGWETEARNSSNIRAASHQPVELTIRCAIDDIFNFVVDTNRVPQAR